MSNGINLEWFDGLYPDAVPGIKEAIISILIPKAMLYAPGTNRLEFCIAQFAHETMGYTKLVELGSPAYFRKYEFSRILGNTTSGDGYLFRGRGLPQLTGRWNYTAFAKSLGVPLTSDFIESVSEPDMAVKAGVWFWNFRNCNTACDLGNFMLLTKLINGGLNGQKDRRKQLERIRLAMRGGE